MEDQRNNLKEVGVVMPCKYCGTDLLLDDEWHTIICCENCVFQAQRENCS